MARITVEDCIRKLPNRFHWVQIETIRTKQLRVGAKPLVNSEENRTAVVPCGRSRRVTSSPTIRPRGTSRERRDPIPADPSLPLRARPAALHTGLTSYARAWGVDTVLRVSRLGSQRFLSSE